MPTLTIDLTHESIASAQVLRADFVRDLIYCLIEEKQHIVPMEWTVESNPVSAVAAIEAYLANEPFVIDGNGHGLFVTLGQPNHPGAEVTGADFEHDLLDFRWTGAAYTGDCSTPITWTLSSSATEIVTTLIAIVT